MKRGDLFRVYKGVKTDPKKYRVFVVISRQVLIDSKFSTVTCAPVYSKYDGLSTQVLAGPEAGLKHDSAIHCDELVSIPKVMLNDYVGRLNDVQREALRNSLCIALDI